MDGYIEDPLDRALAEISSLATNMNEGKRESESRRKLVQWQARIRGRFPSPLVQPHRWVPSGSLFEYLTHPHLQTSHHGRTSPTNPRCAQRDCVVRGDRLEKGCFDRPGRVFVTGVDASVAHRDSVQRPPCPLSGPFRRTRSKLASRPMGCAAYADAASTS